MGVVYSWLSILRVTRHRKTGHVSGLTNARNGAIANTSIANFLSNIFAPVKVRLCGGKSPVRGHPLRIIFTKPHKLCFNQDKGIRQRQRTLNTLIRQSFRYTDFDNRTQRGALATYISDCRPSVTNSMRYKVSTVSAATERELELSSETFGKLRAPCDVWIMLYVPPMTRIF